MAMSMAEDAEAAAVLQPTVANPRITWHSRTVRSPIAEWVSAAVFTKLTLRVAALALFAPIFCFWLDLHGKAIDPSLVSLLVGRPPLSSSVRPSSAASGQWQTCPICARTR